MSGVDEPDGAVESLLGADDIFVPLLGGTVVNARILYSGGGTLVPACKSLINARVAAGFMERTRSSELEAVAADLREVFQQTSVEVDE